MLALAGGVAALIVPEIEDGKNERAAAERSRDEAFEAAKRRRLAREAKPRSGRSERPKGELSPAAELRARRALVRDLERAITRDARARARAGRLDGPVLATRCEINPPSQRRIERDLDAPGSDYECLAITRRDVEGRFVVGDPFDATVDYIAIPVHLGEGMPATRRGRGAARVLKAAVRSVNVPAPMNKRLLLLWISALFLLAGTALAACGDDDDDDDSGGGGGTDTTAAEVETLEVRHAHRSARTFPTPPFEFGDPPDYEGFDVDM